MGVDRKFKPQLQDLLHKNSFYSVKEFNEYFQNKYEAVYSPRCEQPSLRTALLAFTLRLRKTLENLS